MHFGIEEPGEACKETSLRIVFQIKMMFTLLSLVSMAGLSAGLVGYEFQDNKNKKDRFIPENGEMNLKLAAVPDYVAACFSLYVNFNRYSNIIPLIDFRTSHHQVSPFVRVWGEDRKN